jgi:hypothetical protein
MAAARENRMDGPKSSPPRPEIDSAISLTLFSLGTYNLGFT